MKLGEIMPLPHLMDTVDLSSDYKRALTRRRNSRIDCNFVLKLDDDVQIRIKPIIMVDKRIKKSQEKVLRALAHETIEKSLTKLSLSEALKKIYSGDLSKEAAANFEKYLSYQKSRNFKN